MPAEKSILIALVSIATLTMITPNVIADPAHCFGQECYNLGYQHGLANPGTSCPSGHSSNFCAGWDAGASSSSGGGSSIVGRHESSVKTIVGTYRQGDTDGKQNAKDTFNSGGQYDSTCPSGHSDIYCTGYFVGYNYEWTLLKAANS